VMGHTQRVAGERQRSSPADSPRRGLEDGRDTAVAGHRGAIAVTAVAQRRGLQPALVVVLIAAAVSFVPGLPRFELPPS